MAFIFWLVAGALIGYAASQRKGFSMVGGIFGGAFLGFLAPLLFLVSSPKPGAIVDGLKTCRFCKERIKADATVCRYCQKAQPPARPVLPVRKSA